MRTIATPFIDKPYAIRFWLVSFKRLKFPRKEFKLLWIDMSRNEYISGLLKDYIDKYGSEFAEVEYIKDPKKENRNIIEWVDYQNSKFLEKRKSVAETMNIINNHRVGDLILLEDDIIVPENAYEFMNEVFNRSDEFYAVTSVQYSKGTKPENLLLVWDWKEQLVFGEKDTSGEGQVFADARSYVDEKESGIEFVGSTATGFIMYKKEFLDNYVFEREGVWGQDIMVGKNINDLGKKLVLCWAVKTVHLGSDEFGNVKIFRSPLCKTEVINENGIRF